MHVPALLERGLLRYLYCTTKSNLLGTMLVHPAPDVGKLSASVLRRPVVLVAAGAFGMMLSHNHIVCCRLLSTNVERI
jgi:hypothetical protein